MIDSIQFKNLKVLRNAELPLRQLTLLVGPNGSGKTTAFQALEAVAFLGNQEGPGRQPPELSYPDIASAGSDGEVEITANWRFSGQPVVTVLKWVPARGFVGRVHRKRDGSTFAPEQIGLLEKELARFRSYAFDQGAVAAPAMIQHDQELTYTGAGFAAVLDRLKDEEPERFEALKTEMGRWLPEYDTISFDRPASGQKAISLRTRKGGHRIPAPQLSQGTLFALSILTLTYLPNPPAVVAIEEIDRGIHPRLLGDVQTALYRLAFPADFGEKRPGVQVLATTHSPYLLDLYKERPEQVVIAHKKGDDAFFEQLGDRPEIEEVLGGAPLGEVWYSGILGGVPGEP